MFFRALSSDEEMKFRRWARENYLPGSPISGAWHPTVQHESALMNEECATFIMDANDDDSDR